MHCDDGGYGRGRSIVMVMIMIVTKSFFAPFLARAANIFEGRAPRGTDDLSANLASSAAASAFSSPLQQQCFPSPAGVFLPSLPPLSSAFFGCSSLKLSCGPLFSSLSCNSCSLVS